MESAWPGPEALLSFCGLLLRCFAWLLGGLLCLASLVCLIGIGFESFCSLCRPVFGGSRPGGKGSRAGPGAVAPGADLLGLASH